MSKRVVDLLRDQVEVGLGTYLLIDQDMYIVAGMQIITDKRGSVMLVGIEDGEVWEDKTLNVTDVYHFDAMDLLRFLSARCFDNIQIMDSTAEAIEYCNLRYGRPPIPNPDRIISDNERVPSKRKVGLDGREVNMDSYDG